MHHRHRNRLTAGLAVLAALLAAAAIAAPAALTRGAADSEIAVTLGKPSELKMKTSAKTAKAGEVAFVVRNKGKLEHEFILLRTKVKAANLKPRAEDPAKVVEPGFQVELEDIEPGGTVVMALPLKKGHYVLLCNIAGHHAGGMRADLDLK
jgi:uncharacterized cupredoxin-like copper-binding protein